MIIFLTGHRKSGTTLLLRLFDNHPNIDVYPTDLTLFYSYFPYFTNKYSNKEILIKRIILVINETLNKFYINNKLLKAEKIRAYNKKLIIRLKKINLKSKKEVLKEILKHWENLKGTKLKKIILIKETSQSIYFYEYLKIFKNIKMIHIVRDPRDNFASIKSGQKKYYSKIGISYLQNFANFLFRYRQDLLSCFFLKSNSRFTFLTYEDLVTNPTKTMVKICAFLKLKFHKNILSPTIGGQFDYGNNFDKKIFGISKKNANNWITRITIKEKNIIEFYLSDVMKKFNYKNSKNTKNLIEYFSHYNDEINSKYFFVDSLKINRKTNNRT